MFRSLPILLLLTLTIFVSTGATAGEKRFIPVEGLALPTDLALLDIDDHVQTLKPDQPLLINLWASWCAPCLEELPALNRLRQLIPADQLTMVALNYGNSLSAVRRFVADHPIAFPVLLDISTRYSERLAPIGLPVTYLVDRRGQVRFRLEGKADWASDKMVSALRRHLQQMASDETLVQQPQGTSAQPSKTLGQHNI